MADKTIGDLPAASAIYDDDLFLLEQSGEAKNLRGALYKAYLQGFVDAASAASEEAAAALAGVRDAINNIPDGAATPIVNDLTTGGTSMALSAEMGKQLKGDIEGLTYTDVDAAPAGYGSFGEKWLSISAATTEEEQNAALSAVYSELVNDTACQIKIYPRVGNLSLGTVGYGRLYRAWDGYGGLEVCIYGNQFLHKSLWNGVWRPWEWVNPPMQLGVEYRTTERYNDKPVYVKMVNFGTMPNATTKSVAHGVGSFDKCIAIYGNWHVYNLLGAPEITSFYANTVNVNIRTSTDCSPYSAYVVIKYTKTTD